MDLNENTPIKTVTISVPAAEPNTNDVDYFGSSYEESIKTRSDTVNAMIASGRYTTLHDDGTEMETLDQAIEAFEYDLPQNDIYTAERANNGKNAVKISVLRYTVLFLIGVTTGISAFTFDLCIEKLSGLKFETVEWLIKDYQNSSMIQIPGFIWGAFNAVCVAFASIMVVFLSPVAAGSGIPQIKCYLNGINVPFVMRGVTLITKGVGVVLSVAGGLAVGKEGPMIHTGAGIAAGLSQGRLTWCGKSSSLFHAFRNDQQKRDFVSAGAAAGVSAAFGAPVGGLLFSLEEGTSFVNQRLTWQILFCSIVSMFTLGLMFSFANVPFEFTSTGLISFGTFKNLDSYTIFEVVLFIVIGALGGALGAIFNLANIILSKFRKRYLTSAFSKICEACLVAFITAAVGFTMMTYTNDCQPANAQGVFKSPLQMYCDDSEYNAVSSLFFQTPEKSVRSLFHDPKGTYNLGTLFSFTAVYFILACYTYGLSVPSGLFIPCLLLGAAWGRGLGILLNQASPMHFPDPNKFALIGAAAQLGGVVRMTVSLTVILMEATGNIIVGLPILITLVVAKYVGDIFTESIYDMHIDLSGFALLPWEPEDLSVTKKAYEVMSTPVVYLNPVMRVDDLVCRIGKDPHNAFPVVVGEIDERHSRYGTLVGFISRQHLALLIQERVFFEDPENQPITSKLTFSDFDNAYPRFPRLKDVVNLLSPDEKRLYLDMRPYMAQAPYSVPENMTMYRVFNLFRLLGLRHLTVVDRDNQVCGVITRKDLRRFRFELKNGKVHIHELMFSRQINQI